MNMQYGITKSKTCFITSITRDLIISYIDKIIVYEEEKVDIILKYERELIK